MIFDLEPRLLPRTYKELIAIVCEPRPLHLLKPQAAFHRFQKMRKRVSCKPIATAVPSPALPPDLEFPFIEAGATWWVEGDMGSLSFDALRERVRRGRPFED